MPDQTEFDLDAVKARQAAAREQAAADYNPDRPPHLEPHAIAACTICNLDGYRPSGKVCDHREHFESTRHGRALVQAELAKIRNRRAGDQTA